MSLRNVSMKHKSSIINVSVMDENSLSDDGGATSDSSEENNTQIQPEFSISESKPLPAEVTENPYTDDNTLKPDEHISISPHHSVSQSADAQSPLAEINDEIAEIPDPKINQDNLDVVSNADIPLENEELKSNEADIENTMPRHNRIQSAFQIQNEETPGGKPPGQYKDGDILFEDDSSDSEDLFNTNNVCINHYISRITNCLHSCVKILYSY